MNKSELSTRTPQTIALEINKIKEQTRDTILLNSIEIGRRLKEAKIMLSHGEWGEWLEKSVDYSQRTATNLMRIYERFSYNRSNSKVIEKLSYYQATALLSMSREDQNQFIQDLHMVDGKHKYVWEMSGRELLSEIKRVKSRKAIPQIVTKHLINRANGKCEICNWGGLGLEGVLVPHHVHKYSATEDNSLNNLVMLCPNCHAIIHTLDNCRDVGMRNILVNNLNKDLISKISKYVVKMNCDAGTKRETACF